MINKKCYKCKKEKPINKFSKRKQNTDGHLGECKKCNRRAQNKKYLNLSNKKRKEKAAKQRKTRREYEDRIKNITYQLKLKGCTYCPEHNILCIEFHHVDKKERKFKRCYKIDTLIKEIEKCEIVCANCHKKRYGTNHQSSVEDVSYGY